MNWQDSLKNSLGIGEMYCTMKRAGRISEFKFNSEGMFRRNASEAIYFRVRVTKELFQTAEWVQDSSSRGEPLLPDTRSTFLAFCNHWKRIYKVKLNGVEL